MYVPAKKKKNPWAQIVLCEFINLKATLKIFKHNNNSNNKSDDQLPTKKHIIFSQKIIIDKNKKFKYWKWNDNNQIKTLFNENYVFYKPK